MKFSAENIAGIINGQIVGNPLVVVDGLAKIEEGTEGKLSFLANPKYEEFIYSTGSSICIVNNSFEASKELPSTLTLIKVEDAYSCFAKLLQVYDNMHKKQPKIEKNAFIAESASIGKDVYIGANAYVGENVTIGDGANIYPNAVVYDNAKVGKQSVIHANVTIYHQCEVGDNCIIHAGAVIGADGFGFAPDEKGVFSKVPQIGNVVIEDDVEVGANTTIDRATMGSTFIRKGVKIDNLCQIGHNVEIDNHSAMASQAGIAGSTKIGKHVMIGGQAGISGHIKIVDGTQIVAQSGIPNSVKKAEVLMGSPAIPIEDFKKSYFGFRKLPFILKKIQELEQKIKELNK